MWLLVLFFLAFGALAIYGFVSIDTSKRKKESLSAELQRISGFTPQRYVIKTGIKTSIPKGIAIDGIARKIAVIDGESIRVIPFEHLIAVEVIAQGKTITKTSRPSQALGVGLGAVLGGGVGAIVGGLSAATQTKQDVKNVILKLLLNDLESPELQIEFVELQYTGSTSIAAATQEAEDWHNRLRVILFQNEQVSARLD